MLTDLLTYNLLTCGWVALLAQDDLQFWWLNPLKLVKCHGPMFAIRDWFFLKNGQKTYVIQL